MASIPPKYRLLSVILLALGLGFISYSPELIKQFPQLGVFIGLAVFVIREVAKEYGTVLPGTGEPTVTITADDEEKGA